MPLEQDLEIAYESYYTHDSSARDDQTFASRALLRLLGLSKERAGIEAYFLQDHPPGRLLEIGFGQGDRLDGFARLGWEVEGQEFDAVAARNAAERGHKIHLGKLQDLSLPSERYDAVVSSHVIEHVPDPKALFQECLRLLKPGGTLVAVTPNATGYGHSAFRHNWVGLHIPYHLQLFAENNLLKMAEAAGFTELRTLTSLARFPVQCLASMALSKTHRYDMTRTVSSTPQKIQVALHLLFARLLQLTRIRSGDELVLIAKRPLQGVGRMG